MRLLILYGPPASGKLTVAKSVAKASGYPLFHNHMVADFASTLFAYGTSEYAAFSEKLRSMAVDAAIRANLPGLIMTFAYGVETAGGKRDDAVLKSVASRVTRAGGSVLFVRLTCDDASLLRRVGRSDRTKFHKLTKPTILKRILRDYRVKDAVPFAESLVVDTGKLSPAEAAKHILRETK